MSTIGNTPVSTVPFDRLTAERWAEVLYQRFPSMEAWEAAKKDTLGGSLRKEFVHEPSRMPMTTDWWVALQVEEGAGDHIAVEDKGREWDALRTEGRAMGFDETMAWLQTLPLQQASP